ncbi:ABC transporter permease [Actinobacteria bacterium YIM 96077]|uniref:ABC transporter permease n=1 Tax=Phytoactinopolyspora halophila TaxID=1981511 RepID=A0A329QP39_9ACTN|nr:ABC transporter permease [Phytoactinopolyspora halophila]AYY15678.1 ABC transporter permease [Actinobacteria bacterium YIM 96077]RAW14134.1 ABC transporter permease [Phytoactinopolyspora halophila]
MLNPTIVRLTAHGLLGGRRLLVLGSLSLLIVALAVLLQVFAGVNEADAADFLQGVSFGTLLPLFGLIIGTGVIGSEIDDGSIVYVLAKPVSRAVIVRSKLAVAVVAMVLFAVVPTILAALIMAGNTPGLAMAFGAGAVVAGIVYSVIFLLLAIVTRHAVIFGLVYALGWESLVGSFVPGARELSVQQWALSIIDAVETDGFVTAHVDLGVAIVLSVVVIGLFTWLAGRRLAAMTLSTEE